MYNGWKNYETWNVALWIQNDEFLYNLAKAENSLNEDSNRKYENFVRTLNTIEIYQTPDDVKYDDPTLDLDELNEMMEDL